ncbi:putative uncharacterized protein [Janthinobacterium agaricidamnosum NBRC 102515 = DSM 9628]|uniref:DUF1993 domain-containing protein n=1 Tax=Janthinobacterium agaricidamnosum NBRC 102515 = DSM 9628 TaxID=1349767 RepID=W0UZD9_9BURK|nr:putative uncharacterized protein [Janthinobacterium agaricidamnosum NBRC 102515 = DSM 9628]
MYLRGLGVLSTLLEKAEAHAEQGGIVPEVLLGAQLAPDMLDLTAQVQRASDTSKLSGQRLSGVAAPKFDDNEVSFDQLQQRIANTASYLRGLDPAHFDGAASRTITLPLGGSEKQFNGEDYLLTFALPNFFFHLAMAHGILRNHGVQIGKLDYLGPFDA